jgi:TolB protein
MCNTKTRLGKLLLIKLLSAVLLMASGALYAGSADAIAYLRLTDAFWQVWLTDPDGASHRQVTVSPYDKAAVAWGAGAKQLLVSGNDGLIRKVAVDSGAETALLGPELAYDAVYSLDGKVVLYTRPTSALYDNNSLWLINTDGSNNHRLNTFDGLHQSPVWTPSGDIVFAVRQKRGYLQLWVLQPNTGKPPLQLTVQPKDHFDPAVSSKNQLAYTRANNGNYDIFYRDGLDKNEQQLTDSPGFDGEPSWSPDGKTVAYHHAASEDGAGIWAVSISAPFSAKRLTPNTISARSPAWRQ